MTTILEDSYHSLTNSKSMLIILVLILVGVTFFTTLNGVLSYIFGSYKETPILILIIFVIVIFFMQAYLLFRSTSHIVDFRKNNIKKNIAWFFIWAFTFLFSATFSYTFYYDKLSADEHGKNIIKQQITGVVANAQKYLDSFETVKNKMNALAEYSKNTAIKERDKGGTCEGDRSPPGRTGPRMRYRLKDREIFNLQADKVLGLHKKVSNEIRSIRKKQQDFINNIIKTIPELEQKFNDTVRKLNTYNQHPDLYRVKTNLSKRQGKNRKTDGVNSNGNVILCRDDYIDDAINSILLLLESLPSINSVALFDRTNRTELQNRVFEVFLSPFQTNLKNKKNNFGKYDYIALALGFLVETLLLIITYLLHRSDTSYPTNRNGYIGDWFSSTDAIYLQKNLKIKKQDLINVMKSAKKHQTGYMIILETKDDFNPIINVLDRKGLFSKKLNAIEFGSLDKRIQKLEDYEASMIVNIYFSYDKIWTDYRLSLDHLKDNL